MMLPRSIRPGRNGWPRGQRSGGPGTSIVLMSTAPTRRWRPYPNSRRSPDQHPDEPVTPFASPYYSMWIRSHLCPGIDGPHASQRVATRHPERSAEIFITAADSRQIYDRHLVNLRPPRAHIYVLCPTVFASPSRTVSTELNRGLRKSLSGW